MRGVAADDTAGKRDDPAGTEVGGGMCARPSSVVDDGAGPEGTGTTMVERPSSVVETVKQQIVLHGETGNVGCETSEIRLERARRSVHGKEERVILGYEVHTNGFATINPKENMRAFLSIDDYAVTRVV